MQIACNPEYITAIFVKELKNRFLCEVEIDGERVICYVPSSCHLSNFLKLEGKKVLLVPNSTKNTRTQYALFAVPYKRNYIMLNTSIANRAVENSIHSRRFSNLGKREIVIKEHYVSGYKSDLFIEDTNTIVEIKSVLSIDERAEFPTVFSERSLKQLGQLKTLLNDGYRVYYMIVSLNPYVKTIDISKETPFFLELEDCIKRGLCLSAYSCKFDGEKVLVNKKLQIGMEDSTNE